MQPTKAEAPQERVIRVTRVRGNPDYLQADPPEIHFHAEDTLVFEIHDAVEPVFFCPVPDVLDAARNLVRVRDYWRLAVRVLPQPNFRHNDLPYVLYSPEYYGFAEGNSPPRMILDRNP